MRKRSLSLGSEEAGCAGLDVLSVFPNEVLFQKDSRVVLVFEALSRTSHGLLGEIQGSLKQA